MKAIAERVWNEPVIALAVLVGVTTILANAHIISSIFPMIALVIATAIQRQAVEPTNKSDNG